MMAENKGFLSLIYQPYINKISTISLNYANLRMSRNEPYLSRNEPNPDGGEP
jgi:hypothetical protein